MGVVNLSSGGQSLATNCCSLTHACSKCNRTPACSHHTCTPPLCMFQLAGTTNHHASNNYGLCCNTNRAHSTLTSMQVPPRAVSCCLDRSRTHACICYEAHTCCSHLKHGPICRTLFYKAANFQGKSASCAYARRSGTTPGAQPPPWRVSSQLHLMQPPHSNTQSAWNQPVPVSTAGCSPSTSSCCWTP